jgi:hypothetical protein
MVLGKHHNCEKVWLTGANVPGDGGAFRNTVSADQVIAETIGAWELLSGDWSNFETAHGLSGFFPSLLLPRRIAPLTFWAGPMTLCPMKPAVYLTKPEEMRKARLNQPRATSEQARAQRELLQSASEKFSEDAKRETFSRGRTKTTA